MEKANKHYLGKINFKDWLKENRIAIKFWSIFLAFLLIIFIPWSYGIYSILF